MKYTLIDPSTVKIESDTKVLEFKLISNNAELVIGRDRDKYWSPFPSLKAFPIELIVNPNEEFSKTIVYQIKVIE